MPLTKQHEDVRISFLVPYALKERSKKIVWGGRSPALRVLLERLVDAVEKHGQAMIGAVIDGKFEIVPTQIGESDAYLESKGSVQQQHRVGSRHREATQRRVR